jgi:hypothetical protein
MGAFMKRAVLVAVVLLITSLVHAQEKTREDISILRANDPSYADAINAAALFREAGLQINSVHKSKLEGFFRDVWKAALYKTDNGPFEVIFFSEAKQAEKIKVKEVRDGKRYIYSFEGQPQPDPQRDVMNAGYKIFFIMRDNMVIVVSNEKLYEKLKAVFQSF